ncbi:MAG: peptide deformylase [Patescibacteria group bacterium]
MKNKENEGGNKKNSERNTKVSTVLQKDSPVLRSVAEMVKLEEIGTSKIDRIIKRMQKALEIEDDGVAIAAPQIGESLRIFVVSKRVYEIEKKNFGEDLKSKKDMVFINPEIMGKSKKSQIVEEGCLSVRWLYGRVKRVEKVKVRACDQNGKIFTFGGSGLMAQIFQHEIDHLNGILFTDKATNLKEIPPNQEKNKGV